MLQLCDNYRENVQRVDDVLRVRENFDIIKKVLYIGEQETTFYYIDGFVDGGSMNKLMAYFLTLESIYISYPVSWLLTAAIAQVVVILELRKHNGHKTANTTVAT